MRISSFLAASLLAVTDTMAHPEHLERSEVARRSAMSKRCEANASNFNKKRHEKAMAKRAWGTGNSTVEITTESSYCKLSVFVLQRHKRAEERSCALGKVSYKSLVSLLAFFMSFHGC